MFYFCIMHPNFRCEYFSVNAVLSCKKNFVIHARNVIFTISFLLSRQYSCRIDESILYMLYYYIINANLMLWWMKKLESHQKLSILINQLSLYSIHSKPHTHIQTHRHCIVRSAEGPLFILYIYSRMFDSSSLSYRWYRLARWIVIYCNWFVWIHYKHVWWVSYINGRLLIVQSYRLVSSSDLRQEFLI